MKNAGKSYGQPKKNTVNTNIVGLTEPHRVSMYDVLLENLRIAKRATYLHRIIYIGENYFPDLSDLCAFFEGIVKRSNETYCIEKLTGFLLMYPKYFLHMVEGDEDNLNKHLKFLFDQSQPNHDKLRTIKLLTHISHTNQRFFEEWTYYSGVPSKLLESIDIESDLQASSRYIYNCIKKVYSLLSAISQDQLGRPVEDTTKRPPPTDMILDSSLAEKKLSLSKPSPSITPQESVHSKISLSLSNISAGGHQYRLLLPEYELLDFILMTNFTITLQSYHSLYGVVPMRDIYKDKVWPVPSDFIPYDVFEKPYDCVTEIPKEKKGAKPLDETSSFARTDNSRAMSDYTAEVKASENTPKSS